jgi:hypothetical protein
MQLPATIITITMDKKRANPIQQTRHQRMITTDETGIAVAKKTGGRNNRQTGWNATTTPTRTT